MKTPFVTREQLESLTQEFPTPFHLYDEAGIRETARVKGQSNSVIAGSPRNAFRCSVTCFLPEVELLDGRWAFTGY